ncbi:MAG: dUTP diphosphatase [Sphaerochaetaceae bacterium]
MDSGERIIVKAVVKRGALLPLYSTDAAAGADLHAFLPAGESITVQANGGRALIPTGLILEIPPGYEGQVRARSGLAIKHGVTVLNSPGTIDSDYRGEVQVILINHGQHPFSVTNGLRIAQLVVAPVKQGQFIAVEEVNETKRGEQGFGSTGV